MKPCPRCGTLHDRRDSRRRQSYCAACQAAAMRAWRARERLRREAWAAAYPEEALAQRLSAFRSRFGRPRKVVVGEMAVVSRRLPWRPRAHARS